MGNRAKYALVTALHALPILAFVLFVGLAWWALTTVYGTAERIIEREMLPLVDEDVQHLHRLQSSIKVMLEADRDVHQALIAEKDSLVASTDEEHRQADAAHRENIDQARERMIRASAAFDAEVRPVYAQFEQDFAAWEQRTRRVLELARQPDQHQFALRIGYGSAAQTFGVMRGRIDTLAERQEARIKNVADAMRGKIASVHMDVDGLRDLATRIKLLFLAIAGGMTLALLLLGFLVSRTISRPVKRAVAHLTQVTAMISSASEEVAQSSQSLAAGASQQAASLEETASSLEEVAGRTRQNAVHTQQVRDSAADARTLAVQGGEAMERMQGAIAAIKASSDQTAQIMKTVDTVAFQINLLALNAAVEAARAGDAGRGFAVVAEEVRNLAQRSAAAAKDTSAIIVSSQDTADTGVHTATEVAGMLQRIAAAVQQVDELVQEVASASQEQADAVEQVSTAVVQMDQVTQSTAASAEQQAASSEELSSQAQLLTQTIAELHALVGGNGGNGGNGHGQRGGRAALPATPEDGADGLPPAHLVPQFRHDHGTGSHS